MAYSKAKLKTLAIKHLLVLEHSGYEKFLYVQQDIPLNDSGACCILVT
jgi:hypothetical protein